MMDVQVNYLAVLLAGLSAMVVGYFWYSPMLFANAWVKSMGMKLSDMKMDNMPLTYGLMFAGALVQAYVLKHVLTFAQPADVMTASMGGFWMWLGFIVPFALTGVLFEKKNWNWYFITVGYHLVTLLAMSVILYSIQ